jgi:hypothetical protein
MQNPRAGLAETFRQMSDDELRERWCAGCLTDLAIEVAQQEMALRGLAAPPYVAMETEPRGAQDDSPSELVEIARSQLISDLQMLRARLDSEGIPSLIVNENSNRMGPQFSNTAGGARLLVLSQFALDAKQIVALLNSGAFALREDDDVR